MKNFTIPNIPDISDEQYWRERAIMEQQWPELLEMEKCCHDCAVENGFYLKISNSLKKQPIQIQNIISKRWFCHNNPKKACKGNIVNLQLK